MHKFMRLVLPAFAVALFFSPFTATETNAQGVLQEILKRMDQQNKSLTSLRASVTMTKVNSQLGGVADVSKGTAMYLPQKGKDAFVRIDWTTPNESLAVKNKKYVIFRPHLKIAYTGSVDKAQGTGKANSALAFVNMSRAQLKANYDVEYLGDETVSSGAQTWHLKLTPKTPSSYKWAEVWIDKDGFPVQSKILEKNNDTTTVLLSNLEKNLTLNASVFQITIPKGTKVIES
jgi:outer membrane lipoprotein-sorting protein